MKHRYPRSNQDFQVLQHNLNIIFRQTNRICARIMSNKLVLDDMQQAPHITRARIVFVVDNKVETIILGEILESTPCLARSRRAVNCARSLFPTCIDVLVGFCFFVCLVCQVEKKKRGLIIFRDAGNLCPPVENVVEQGIVRWLKAFEAWGLSIPILR